jgi:hypothetical protein
MKSTALLTKVEECCTIAWDLQNVHSSLFKAQMDVLCQGIRNLDFIKRCRRKNIFVAFNAVLTPEETRRSLNKAEKVYTNHCDTSKNAADDKIKDYIDDYLEDNHDRANVVKIVLLTGDKDFADYCADKKNMYKNVQILCIYPKQHARSLLTAVDHYMPFSELVNHVLKDLVRPIFYGTVLFHIRFPLWKESEVKKLMSQAPEHYCTRRLSKDGGRVDFSVQLRSISDAYELEKNLTKNMNSIVRFPDSKAVQTMLRILSIDSAHPARLQLEYKNKFKQFVPVDFIGATLVEHAISRTVRSLQNSDLLISPAQFKHKVQDLCKISHVDFFDDTLILLQENDNLIEKVTDQNSNEYLIHKDGLRYHQFVYQCSQVLLRLLDQHQPQEEARTLRMLPANSFVTVYEKMFPDNPQVFHNLEDWGCPVKIEDDLVIIKAFFRRFYANYKHRSSVIQKPNHGFNNQSANNDIQEMDYFIKRYGIYFIKDDGKPGQDLINFKAVFNSNKNYIIHK